MSPQNVSITYSDLSKIGYSSINVHGQRSVYRLSTTFNKNQWNVEEINLEN